VEQNMREKGQTLHTNEPTEIQYSGIIGN